MHLVEEGLTIKKKINENNKKLLNFKKKKKEDHGAFCSPSTQKFVHHCISRCFNINILKNIINSHKFQDLTIY